MPTRNVNLTDRYDRLVDSLIASGQYQNASEVVRAGLRLLEKSNEEEDEKLRALRGLAAEAFASLDRNEGTRIEGDQQLAEFIREIGLRAANRSARRSGIR